ncbi:MAG: hypothetical protein HFJ84_10105 [Clostridiales bacterium]|nr:hypothetical protein [Clostridiales bacterium]
MKLVLTNQTGGYDVTEQVQKVTLSGDYQQCARTLEISMLLKSCQRTGGRHHPHNQTWESLVFQNGDHAALYHENQLLFSGNIETRARDSESSLVTLTAYDGGRILKKNTDAIKAAGLTPEGLVQTIAQKYGVPLGEIASTGVKLKKNYIQRSLYDMIQSAYTDAGEALGKKYIVRFEGQKLCVREKIRRDTTVLESGVNLFSSSVTESVADMVNQVVIVDENDKVLQTLKNDEDIARYGLAQVMVKQTSEDLTAQAKKKLEDGREEQKITVQNFGNPAYITGNAVVVKDTVTGLSGLFWIDSDVHSWKNGLYQNRLTLNFRNIMDEKDVGEEEK